MTVPLAIELSTAPEKFNLYVAYENEILVYDYLTQKFIFKIEACTRERLLLFSNDKYSLKCSYSTL